MFLRLRASLLLAAHLAPGSRASVGDEVCITGYIVDDQERGFRVLGDEAPGVDGRRCGFRIDDADAVLAAGRALKGSDTGFGHRATVKGTVQEAGDGSDGLNGPPLLTNVEILEEGARCDGELAIPPLCASSFRKDDDGEEAALGTTNEPTVVELGSKSSLSSAVAVGDKVCTVGYLMDNFCIYDNNCGDDGFPNCQMLDNPGIKTLEAPEKHNAYCLNIPRCINSGFQVLGPKDPATGMHSLGYRLDSTEEVKDFANANSGPAPQATVRGTVKEAGDGTTGREGPPLLTDLEVLSADVGCEDAVPETTPSPVTSKPSSKPVTPDPTPNPVAPEPSPNAEPAEEPAGSASAASSQFVALLVVVSASLAI